MHREHTDEVLVHTAASLCTGTVRAHSMCIVDVLVLVCKHDLTSEYIYLW